MKISGSAEEALSTPTDGTMLALREVTKVSGLIRGLDQLMFKGAAV